MNASISKLTALISMILLFSSPSLGLMTLDDARKTVRETQNSCPELDCVGSRAQVKALTSEDIEILPEETQEFLRAAAKNYAEYTWPDTILESSYEVDFRIELENLEVLSIDGKNIGYRLLFSVPAWNRDECPAFTQEEMDLKSISELVKEKCQSGRIFDRTFVLPDPTGSFDDENFRPEFHSTN
jgi:hypothetical protein